MRVVYSSPQLSVRRLTGSDWEALQPTDLELLGVMGYGVFPKSQSQQVSAIHARMLLGNKPLVDAWLGSAPVRSGRCGSVAWHCDPHWVHGLTELDEAAAGSDLTLLAEQAYNDIFNTLKATGMPHLVRLWNYLPDINRDSGGMERYRQFNVGRQKAFLAAHHDVFEGAPAACALGTRGGPFSVRFIAGKTRPLQVENPRQISAYHYPSDYGPRSPTFSRAALVEAGNGQIALLISGTASIVGHTSVHPGNVAAQTRETLTNLQAVIASAHRQSAARFSLNALYCTVYIRNAEDAAAVQQEIAAAAGAGSTTAEAAIYLQADICRSDLLVEIEAHAFAVNVV